MIADRLVAGKWGSAHPIVWMLTSTNAPGFGVRTSPTLSRRRGRRAATRSAARQHAHNRTLCVAVRRLRFLCERLPRQSPPSASKVRGRRLTTGTGQVSRRPPRRSNPVRGYLCLQDRLGLPRPPGPAQARVRCPAGRSVRGCPPGWLSVALSWHVSWPGTVVRRGSRRVCSARSSVARPC